MLKENIALFFILTLLLFLSGCRKHENRREITVAGNEISVYLARTPGERIRGLAGKEKIGENEGMLFIFPNTKKRSFWMMGCKYSLDLAYINRNGIIREIVTMGREKPGTPVSKMKRYPSKSDEIKYALEMRAGWFKKHGVEPGTRIDLEDFNAIY